MPVPDWTSAAGQHERLVRRIARETQAPEEVARRAYIRELERLGRDARVRLYLPVLAARHAREALRHAAG